MQTIRGFRDILPEQIALWQKVEQEAAALFESFGYREIRIPIVEKTTLFARSIGETTDIVEKEMYTFEDRTGDMLTLRPEATASICRAYIQHKMYATQVLSDRPHVSQRAAAKGSLSPVLPDRCRGFWG